MKRKMMKDKVSEFGITKRLKCLSGKVEMFCYRCGKTLYNDDENCETDRFGRSFCSEECKNFYYGGED